MIFLNKMNYKNSSLQTTSTKNALLVVSSTKYVVKTKKYIALSLQCFKS